MGTAFDAPVPASGTDYFEAEPEPQLGMTQEQWLRVRRNRRTLFNAMKAQGFMNYKAEWWHFGLGDPLWAALHDLDWCYPSMEAAIPQGEAQAPGHHEPTKRP
jgi:D-alanyl-D-alanine dipeptidase